MDIFRRESDLAQQTSVYAPQIESDSVLTPLQVKNALVKAPMLPLSRQQLVSLISQMPFDSSGDIPLFDFVKGVHLVASIIENMFDQARLAQHANLLEHAQANSMEMMGGNDEAGYRRHLNKIFEEFDEDDSGYLDVRVRNEGRSLLH